MGSKNAYAIILVSSLLAIIIGVFLFKKYGFDQSKNDHEQNEFGKINFRAPLQTKQLAPLIGKWHCISEDLLPDSTIYQSRAEWTFRYVLDGYAIEDVWVEKKEDSTNNTIRLGRDFMGKNIRIFNPALKKWQCVWIDNRNNSISPIWEATFKNDTITMHDKSFSWKIIFFNMEERSFDWKYLVKNGSKWSTVSTIYASRIK